MVRYNGSLEHSDPFLFLRSLPLPASGEHHESTAYLPMDRGWSERPIFTPLARRCVNS
ncbi:hypothetical protein Poly21_48960 [Allorhodopirellula heiligendammensis]|uniref:Uncharacterized protein n=1 Tax=Allorhodopirellula heiligendammensis TaxID=2714739 RepID=A0A5C6BIG0_9BACT|nr:hypothetical protein Poly21_48960 [Allorhodopirellula heiligendammensis]